MTYRIINTKEDVKGPSGISYIYDAARPFALLRAIGSREICVARYSTEKAARRVLQARLDGEPLTYAGSLD